MAGRWSRLYKMTPAEHALEPAVAALGVPYRVQHPLYLGYDGPALRYFPDFVLLQQRVIFEVDDPSHWQDPEKVAADKVRTAALEAAGWTVRRCTNAEALSRPRQAVAKMLAGIPGPWAVPVDGEHLPGQPTAAPAERRGRQAVPRARGSSPRSPRRPPA